LAISFRDKHAPDRPGTIRSVPEFFRQFVQPLVSSVRLDVREALAVNPRRAAIIATAHEGPLQDVSAIQLVIQRIEPNPGGPLGSDHSWDGLFHPFPLHPQRRRPSPAECEVGVHIGRFEACSTFTCVTACRLAASPKRRICLEGSDGFVTSTAAPIATGWSDHVANNRGERLASWCSPWAVPRSDIRCAPPPR